MQIYYSGEKNVQILIALLKAHHIKRVVVSPGGQSIPFVGSVQADSFFELFSVVDERSATYIACGLAAESKEPVVLSCTGATASRNYMSGLTEAYYRKLPILAVTSTQDISRVGHHVAQVTDRSTLPKDIVKLSVHLQHVKDSNDWWDCNVKVNKALLELKRHGGGPVHVNLTTYFPKLFNTKKLPKVRIINRLSIHSDDFPELPRGRVAVFVGSHTKMSEGQIDALERFCAVNNAVVFCDHTSGYNGKYCVIHSLSSSQRLADFGDLRPYLTIHIGEVSGDYSADRGIIGEEVWRVSEDGEIRDTFRKLKYVFEMPEQAFFKYYAHDSNNNSDSSYLEAWNKHLDKLRNDIPDLPFSNIWAANKIHNRIPENSVVHLGILNSLRSWNFFRLPETVEAASNVGGFGIDGCLSALIGSSLVNRSRLYFGIIGDLSFFYDLNSIGNRHVGNNVRILLVNNGMGIEFRNFDNPAAMFGDSVNDFIAAAGHFGKKSRTLVKNYSENLGFEYISASNKDEFEHAYERFITPDMLEHPILFEVFTDHADESNALELITSISTNVKGKINVVKSVVGPKALNVANNVIGPTNSEKLVRKLSQTVFRRI